MNKTTFVAFLLLASSTLLANNITPEINRIESQWANIYYNKNNSQQRDDYPKLLERTQHLSIKFPNAIELTIWQAIIIATNAAFESPFTALESLDKAKNLLEFALQIEPVALDGAAYVTLGTLYYLTPGWPISFGDQKMAETLLEKALVINPKGIESNYFYADYLLSIGKIDEATKYFKLAINSPNRPEQVFADQELKKEALIALKNTEQRKLDSGKNKFFSLFSSAKSN